MRRLFGLSVLIAASLLIGACNGGTTNTNAPKNANVNTATTAPAANNEADVKKLIGDLAAALGKNDAAALDKIYADDYVLVQQDGNVATKAERVGAIKSGDLKFENVEFKNVKVRSYGDSAVALADSSGKSTNKGKTVETAYRITFVAHKTKDGWRLVSAHLSPMAAGADDKKADDSKKDAPDAAKKDDGAKPDDKKTEEKKPDDK
jgi:uncharacterized protein (TIGR02246 family)